MPKLVIIANDIRSSHNVGALFRLSDGLGIEKLILVGISPYPTQANDKRLPHLSKKIANQINKTALGAVNTVKWTYYEKLIEAINDLKSQDYTILALEQDKKSVFISKYKPKTRMALMVGNEVNGLEPNELKLVNTIIELPMLGAKESHNVVTASAIAAYHLLNM
jgi:tRNA G18 (ribose-2'-O)-methylase SpoU